MSGTMKVAGRCANSPGRGQPLVRGVVVADATCSFEGCEKPVWARTLCGTHYSRWRRRGDVAAPLVQRRGTCSVEGCDDKHQARGYCDKHYRRLLDHGDPDTVGTPGPSRGANVGATNPAWKGDDAGYMAVHLRLKTLYGPAADHTCHCGAPAAQWAYLHNDPAEKVSPDGLPYSTDPARYTAMCAPCHVAFDQLR